jgi:hypothetical protein
MDIKGDIMGNNNIVRWICPNPENTLISVEELFQKFSHKMIRHMDESYTIDFENISDDILIADDYGWTKIELMERTPRSTIFSAYENQGSSNWVTLKIGDTELTVLGSSTLPVYEYDMTLDIKTHPPALKIKYIPQIWFQHKFLFKIYRTSYESPSYAPLHTTIHHNSGPEYCYQILTKSGSFNVNNISMNYGAFL